MPRGNFLDLGRGAKYAVESSLPLRSQSPLLPLHPGSPSCAWREVEGGEKEYTTNILTPRAKHKQQRSPFCLSKFWSCCDTYTFIMRLQTFIEVRSRVRSVLFLSCRFFFPILFKMPHTSLFNTCSATAKTLQLQASYQGRESIWVLCFLLCFDDLDDHVKISTLAHSEWSARRVLKS